MYSTRSLHFVKTLIRTFFLFSFFFHLFVKILLSKLNMDYNTLVHGHPRMYPATKLHDSVHLVKLVTHTLNSWKHEMHGIYKNEITQ